MALSKRDQAVSAANTVISFMQQLRSLRQGINEFVTEYNSEGYSTTWAAMQTAPFNSDGSVSGTPDGSPNVANPINNAALAKYASKNQLVAAVVLMQQLQNFFTNAAVTQGNYNQTIDDLAS